ncbi:beta-ketoacyl synthase chain length factor [Paramixta manurensis]|uniref:Beta-ketoacyl synthase chain length factor n=1 Tax=Paramixta manurensis TaxID=2740817 RepID=A0A6M8U7L7_9GAMM|nr:beta-ketoacyl synthase chain length factor [Erwiniaceae bacterium PD-1]
MKLAFTLIDWQASAPGLSQAAEWQHWAQQPAVPPDADRPLEKCSTLPMMTARRLASGSRAAVDCGMALMMRQSVDAIVFTSRHGELERSLRLMTAIAQQQSASPTDFAMSVHNAAVGSLTIAAQAALVSTSLSAGVDSFQQGLVEVSALHHAGYQQVLLVDFDGVVPAFYRPYLPPHTPHAPYAVALLLGVGQGMTCVAEPVNDQAEPSLPQSLQFLHGLLSQQRAFTVGGDRFLWRWAAQNG